MQIRYGQQSMQSGIYLIKCKENDTVYVGQSVNMSRRTAYHRQMLRRGEHDNRHLQRAYDKYGEDNFEVRYVITCDTEDLTHYETQVLSIFKRHYKAFNSEAPVDTPMLGRKREYNENSINALHEYRDKAHEALARKRREDKDYLEFTREVGRKAMSKLRADPEIEAKRKKKSAKAQARPELVELRRKQLLERFENGWKPKRNPKTTKVINTETGEVFQSYTEASEKYGVSTATVHRWVNGRRDGRNKNTKGKPNWRVYED